MRRLRPVKAERKFFRTTNPRPVVRRGFFMSWRESLSFRASAGREKSAWMAGAWIFRGAQNDSKLPLLHVNLGTPLLEFLRGGYFAFLPPPPPRLMGACVMALAAAFFSAGVTFFAATADFLFSSSCLRFDAGFLSVCFLPFAILVPQYFESSIPGHPFIYCKYTDTLFTAYVPSGKKTVREQQTPARVS